MQLIGMLDSPYVRRVAIALRLLDLPFEHRPLSVFRQMPQFQAINPVVKAPTLVIGGTASAPGLQRAARATADAIPGARHHSLEGQTHEIVAEVTAPVLAEFFSRAG